MLVGYDANNIFRNGGPLGEYSRSLMENLATGRVGKFHALLFSTRIKAAFRTQYTSFSNISTYVPTGMARLLPSAWMRYRLNPMLKTEKVKIFHGLNEELPYGIARDIKTVITCYGLEKHYKTSLLDSFLWHRRMKYSFRASDVIVAVSEDVKRQLVGAGVSEQKIVVIGNEEGADPLAMNSTLASKYFSLYQTLAGEE